MPTSEEDREREFLAYVESTTEYNAAIIERGGIPWHHGDIERRRALFMRRYRRPEPPEGLAPISSIESYQRKQTDETTAQRIESAYAASASPTRQAA